jgi:hypothetical protein
MTLQHNPEIRRPGGVALFSIPDDDVILWLSL